MFAGVLIIIIIFLYNIYKKSKEQNKTIEQVITDIDNLKDTDL